MVSILQVYHKLILIVKHECDNGGWVVNIHCAANGFEVVILLMTCTRDDYLE